METANNKCGEEAAKWKAVPGSMGRLWCAITPQICPENVTVLSQLEGGCEPQGKKGKQDVSIVDLNIYTQSGRV